MKPDMLARVTPWKTVILLCGKCARKMKGGYGADGKDTLKTALRVEIKAAGHGRHVRVIETRCLGLCPKKAVTALNASQPNRMLAIPRGTTIGEATDVLLARHDQPPPPAEVS